MQHLAKKKKRKCYNNVHICCFNLGRSLPVETPHKRGSVWAQHNIWCMLQSTHCKATMLHAPPHKEVPCKNMTDMYKLTQTARLLMSFIQVKCAFAQPSAHAPSFATLASAKINRKSTMVGPTLWLRWQPAVASGKYLLASTGFGPRNVCIAHS